jgi:hypothetical protein
VTSSHSPQLALIRSLIERRFRFDPATETPGTIRVERGAVLADAVINRTQAIDSWPGFDSDALRVVDGSGHARSVYPGLMRYCLALAASGRLGLVPAHHRSPGSAPPTGFRDGINPARLGGTITGGVWSALADWAANESARSAELIRGVIANRSADGSFLTPSPADNPETFWFHDLILLHAADAFADLSGDPAAADAARAAAEYHQNRTQPDHATGEPWGLSAFLKSPATAETADALLHTVQITHPNGPRGVTLLLLADTLYRAQLGG